MICFNYNKNITFVLQLVLFTVTLIQNTTSTTVEYDSSDLTTFINPGANIIRREDVKVYTDTMDLTFIIPAIPNAPTLTPGVKCPVGKELWCRGISATNDILQQSQVILKSFQKMFTYNGLPIIHRKNEITNNDTLSTLSTEDWNAYAQKRIEDRRNPFLNKYHEPRSIPTAIVKAAATAFLPLLINEMKNLFVPNNKILPYLTEMREAAPNSLKSIIDLPTHDSEFRTVGDVSSKVTSAANERFMNNYKSDIIDYTGFQSTHKIEQDKGGLELIVVDSILRTEENVHNTVNLLNAAIRTMAHLSAIHDCRNNQIPMLFVPHSLLQARLTELELTLDNDLQLLLPSSNYTSYYSTNTAKCTFDKDGGIVQVQTHLIHRYNKYELYEFQSIAFAWHNYTCDLGISSTYIVREENSKDIYPISDVDEEACSPKLSGLCKVPQAANADVPHHYCLMSIMQEMPNSEVKDACPFTCRLGTRITSTQISNNEFIVAHLPKKGAIVRCDKFHKDVNHKIDVGSLRIRLKCGCSLEYDNTIVVRSDPTKCYTSINDEYFEVDHVLPLQVTDRLDTWIPIIKESFHEVEFIPKTRLINKRWTPNSHTNANKKSTNSVTFNISKWPIFFSIFNILLSLVMVYTHKDNNGRARWIGLLLSLVFRADGTEGAVMIAEENCVLPTNITVTVFFTMLLVLCKFLPKFIVFIISFCKRMLVRKIEKVAVKRIYRI